MKVKILDSRAGTEKSADEIGRQAAGKIPLQGRLMVRDTHRFRGSAWRLRCSGELRRRSGRQSDMVVR